MPQDNPPLLDKTMNTTESIPRNLADVLASGLANIANNVKPDASDIPLDPITGMSATNVQNGVSELKQSLDGLFKILFGGASTDLNNIPSTAGTVIVYTFTSGTSNIPVSGSGYCFTFLNIDSAIYGRQIVIMNNGIYTRKLQNGSFQQWQYVNLTNQ